MLHWLVRSIVSTAIVASWQLAAAQSNSAEFFKDKTIKLVVSTGPGGAYGLYALLFAAHYGRHLPGTPVVVPEYRPGAGGMLAANYLYSAAPRDGSVLGIPLAPIVLAQFTAASVARYDASKFVWIGQMANMQRLFVVWESSKITKFEDLTTYDSIAGNTGKGSETFINPAIINHIFGAKIKIVGGYQGSADLLLALERGEITAISATWSNFNGTHADWLTNGKVRFLAQIGLSKLAAYDNIPLLSDLAKNEADRQLIEFMSLVTNSVGYSVMAPPGVPEKIAAAMRQAFDETMRDPAFVAEAEKRRLELDPAKYTVVESAIRKAIDAPQELRTRFLGAIGEP